MAAENGCLSESKLKEYEMEEQITTESLETELWAMQSKGDTSSPRYQAARQLYFDLLRQAEPSRPEPPAISEEMEALQAEIRSLPVGSRKYVEARQKYVEALRAQQQKPAPEIPSRESLSRRLNELSQQGKFDSVEFQAVCNSLVRHYDG